MNGEPERIGGGEAAYAAAYLRYYRETVVAKCRALPESELRRARLPSRWTPLELLAHLAFMEQRWFVWGFLGEQVAAPWGDNMGGDPGQRWFVPEERSLDELVGFLTEVAARTDDVLAQYEPTQLATLGGRFGGGPPPLRWICYHVLQEYARHAGHLDVAVELAGGPIGE